MGYRNLLPLQAAVVTGGEVTIEVGGYDDWSARRRVVDRSAATTVIAAVRPEDVRARRPRA